MSLLDTQISIYALDTGNFYSSTEAFLHWKNHKLRNERNQLINGYVIKNSEGKTRRIIGLKEIENEFNKYDLDAKDIELIQKQEYDFSQCEKYSDELIKLSEYYYKIKDLITIKNKVIKKT